MSFGPVDQVKSKIKAAMHNGSLYLKFDDVVALRREIRALPKVEENMVLGWCSRNHGEDLTRLLSKTFYLRFLEERRYCSNSVGFVLANNTHCGELVKRAEKQDNYEPPNRFNQPTRY